MLRTCKKIYVFVCTVAAAILIFSIAALYHSGNIGDVGKTVRHDAAYLVAAGLDSPELTVILRASDGHVCICSDSGDLLADTGISVGLLPSAERDRLLTDGIVLKAADLVRYLAELEKK